MAHALECLVTGTDTGVGKTHVVSLLVRSLRAAGRQVWLHKPVACGDWDGERAGDAITLAPLVGDGQDPASLCRHQWPEAASPHLAAAAAGDTVALSSLRQEVSELRGEHDLIVEGAGGLLSPLSSDRGTLADLAVALQLPLLLVTRPHLGTLNHTCLTVTHARACNIPLLGIVINHHEPVAESLATRTVADELAQLTALPVLAELPHNADSGHGDALAAALLARHAAAPR